MFVYIIQKEKKEIILKKKIDEIKYNIKRIKNFLKNNYLSLK